MTANVDHKQFLWLEFFLLLVFCALLPVYYVYIIEVTSSSRHRTAYSSEVKWPLYTFFDDEYVDETTSRPDPMLLDKILNDIAYFRTKIFRRKGTETDHQIPRIIHQSWKSESVPHVAVPWMKKWKELHPDWIYIFWTDRKADTFIREYYPNLWKFYRSWNVPVQRSDMFRVLAIYAFGGVWADLDMVPLKNLEPIRSWSACILARHPEIQTNMIDVVDRGDIYATNFTYTINAFFACRAGHPFMFYMLSRLVQSSPLWTGERCTLDRTVACSGPRLMAIANAFYLRSVPERKRRDRPEFDVICPEAEWFMPTYDTTYSRNLPRIRRRCWSPQNAIEAKLCAEFNSPSHKNEPKNFSYTEHMWFHSYNFRGNTAYYRGSLQELVTFQNYDDAGLFETVDAHEYQRYLL